MHYIQRVVTHKSMYTNTKKKKTKNTFSTITSTEKEIQQITYKGQKRQQSIRERVWRISQISLLIIIIMIMTTITTTMIINRSCVAFCHSGTEGAPLPGGDRTEDNGKKRVERQPQSIQDVWLTSNFLANTNC